MDLLKVPFLTNDDRGKKSDDRGSDLGIRGATVFFRRLCAFGYGNRLVYGCGCYVVWCMTWPKLCNFTPDFGDR